MEITDESSLSGGVSGKIRSVEASENAGDGDRGEGEGVRGRGEGVRGGAERVRRGGITSTVRG